MEVYTLLNAILVFFLRIHGEISTSFFNCVIVLMIALRSDLLFLFQDIFGRSSQIHSLDGKLIVESHRRESSILLL